MSGRRLSSKRPTRPCVPARKDSRSRALTPMQWSVAILRPRNAGGSLRTSSTTASLLKNSSRTCLPSTTQGDGYKTRNSVTTSGTATCDRWRAARHRSSPGSDSSCYCDPAPVGHSAVRLGALVAGFPSELFQRFVATSVFQPRRDTVIPGRQRKMAAAGRKRLAFATALLNRTGNMGEIPTSGWLRGWKGGALRACAPRVWTWKTRRWWPFW